MGEREDKNRTIRASRKDVLQDLRNRRVALLKELRDLDVAIEVLGEVAGETQQTAIADGSEAQDVTHAARELGRRGGQKGGVARAAALSPERRSEIARKAANARWGNA